MKRGKTILWLSIIVLLVDLFTLIIAAFKGPYPGVVPLGSPTAYRNIYIHVPISVSSYVVFTVALVFALLYLTRGSTGYERMAHNAIILGVILGASCLVTGSIWARESWGSWWNWDPRETGILFMWLAYLVYFVVRSSIRDPDVAPRISMTYAVAAYATIPLSFMLPYIMESLHPRVQETSEFIRSSSLTELLFPARMIIVVIIPLLLLALSRIHMERRYAATLKALAAILVAASIAGAAIELAPYASSGTLGSTPSGRVEFRGTVDSGNYTSGVLTLNVYSGNVNVTVVYRGKPPINPITMEYGGEMHITLEKHYVYVKGVTEKPGVVNAEELKVLVYWGVPVNMAIYSVTVTALLATSLKIAGKEERN